MKIRLDEFLKNTLLVSIGWKDLLAPKSSVKVKSNLDFRSRTRERNKKKKKREKEETVLFYETAENDAPPRDTAFSRRRNGMKRGGGFSHVAVRSCASRSRKSLVREPRLLRPSITLTPGDRGMENGTSSRRALPADRRWKSESWL